MKLNEKLLQLKEEWENSGSEATWVDEAEVWTDEDEIGELVRQAFEKGIDTDVVIACAQACRTREGFQHHLSGAMGARKLRILLVDDEESYLDLLKMNIERTGRYEVQTESDPTAAVKHIEEFRPDLCVIDVIMPEMDGFELIHVIREKSHLSSVPLIMLTALLRDSDDDARTHENTLVLSKPVDTKRLLYCIDEHVRSSGSASP